MYPDELKFEENGKTYQKFYNAAKHDNDYWSAKCTGTVLFSKEPKHDYVFLFQLQHFKIYFGNNNFLGSVMLPVYHIYEVEANSAPSFKSLDYLFATLKTTK